MGYSHVPKKSPRYESNLLRRQRSQKHRSRQHQSLRLTRGLVRRIKMRSCNALILWLANQWKCVSWMRIAKITSWSSQRKKPWKMAPSRGCFTYPKLNYFAIVKLILRPSLSMSKTLNFLRSFRGGYERLFWQVCRLGRRVWRRKWDRGNVYYRGRNQRFYFR